MLVKLKIMLYNKCVRCFMNTYEIRLKFSDTNIEIVKVVANDRRTALQEYLNHCNENDLIALKYLDRLSIKEI